jgi:hypothetical protein
LAPNHKEFSLFCNTAWTAIPDPRFHYNKYLSKKRLEEDSMKIMQDEKKVFSAQQMRRFQQQEAREKTVTCAQGRVRQYLINRDMRYELKAAQQKQQAKREAFVEKHKKAAMSLR